MPHPPIFDPTPEAHALPSTTLTSALTTYSAALTDALKSDPSDPIALGEYAATLLHSAATFERACEYFELCLKACADDEDASGAAINQIYITTFCTFSAIYAQGLLANNAATHYDKVEKLYARGLELEPMNPLLSGDYPVFLHRYAKKYAKAETHYRAHLANFPEHATAWTKYGNFLKSVKRDAAGAEAAYKSGVTLAPTNCDCLSSYAVFCHGTKGDYKTAENIYERAHAADPTHVNNLSNYGLFLSEIKSDFERAEGMYKQAMDIDRNHPNSMYNYAVLCDSGMGKQAEAEELYRRCLTVNPNHAYALYNLAVLVEERRGHTQAGREEADECFQKAVKVSKNDAVTLADYGRFKLVCCKEIEAAEKLLRSSRELDRNCVVALFNLGVLLYNCKEDRKGAEECFRAAVKADPDHSETYRYLGRIMADKSDLVNSGKFYAMAMERAKDGEAAAAIKKEMEASGVAAGSSRRLSK